MEEEEGKITSIPWGLNLKINSSVDSRSTSNKETCSIIQKKEMFIHLLIMRPNVQQ